MTCKEIQISPFSPSLGTNPLARKIASLIQGQPRLVTALPGLTLYCHFAPTTPGFANVAPSVCLIGQGAKCAIMGGERLIYDAERYLVTSVDLPLITQVIKASPQEPYLALGLTLDRRLITELLLESGSFPRDTPETRRGAAVSKITPGLAGAFIRLLDCLASPADLSILAPLIIKEISYRLLKSEQGPRLRQLVSEGVHRSGVAQAIEWLKRNFEKPFQVSSLAKSVGMSLSSFHHHFHDVTALSPVQYQKRLRLIEARRVMLEENLNVCGAAYRVGYVSPNQFSREYTRFFGAPPYRDLKGLRGDLAAEPGANRKSAKKAPL
ncbi:MAG: AraC family transcriptional regulator [Deltaproteobacteria bacterium]|nr:AraC family transcriptional regulator [Deltaproteobacteria bacterium]